MASLTTVVATQPCHRAARCASGGSTAGAAVHPVPKSATRVRVAARAGGGAAPPLHASWERTPRGYSVRIALERSALGADATKAFKLGVAVNEMTPDRERRRGQLVMGGRAGDFVYLRGDRLAPDDLLDFRIADD